MDRLCKRLSSILAALLMTMSMVQTTYAVDINGWTYNIPDFVMTAYNVRNFQYDGFGRVTTFTTTEGAGTAVYSDPVYDSSGNLISSTVRVTGIPPVAGQSAPISRAGSSGTASSGLAQALAVSQYVSAAASSANQTTQAIQSVNQAAMLAQRRAIEGALYGRIRYALGPKGSTTPSGISSGDADSPWSVWADGSLTTYGSTRSGAQNAGTASLALLGFEYMPSDKFIAGVSLGYNYNYTTHYVGFGARQQDYGFVINPYLGFSPVENLLLAIQGGFTFGNTSINGTSFAGGSFSKNYGTFMGAVGADLSYAFVFDRLIITPHVGYSYSSQQPSVGSIKGVQIGMLNAGGIINYKFDKFVPYISATYSYDTIGQDNVPRGDMLGVLGFTYEPTDNFQFSGSVANSFFKYKTNETRFEINLRYAF
jgi:YD repeat-containing protein